MRRQGGEVVRLPRIEQVVFRERARRDDSRDFALDQALGERRILHLVADGDTVSGLK